MRLHAKTQSSGRFRLTLLLLTAAALVLLPSAAASAAINSHVTVEGTGSGAVVPVEGEEALAGSPPIECHKPSQVGDVCDTEAVKSTPEAFFAGIFVTYEEAPGSEFVEWDVEEGFDVGECDTSTFGLKTECGVALFGEPGIKITAVFEAVAVEEFALNLSTSGEGTGSFECDTGSGPEACEAEYPDGTEVEVLPVADEGSEFAEWTGECSGSGSCVVTMDEARSVGAAFDLEAVQDVHITIEGSGAGKVIGAEGEAEGNPRVECEYASPGPATGACDVEAGTALGFLPFITVQEQAAPGSEFAGWTVEEGTDPFGSCTDPQGSACGASHEAGEEIRIKAVFEEEAPAEPHLLTAAKTGSGNGWIHSSPAGINCGLGCTTSKTESFEGTVTLTAYGSQFTGWEVCPGVESGRECTVEMDADKEAVAEFSVNHSITVTKTGTGNGWVHSSPAGINCGLACTTKVGFFEVSSVVLTAYGSQFSSWTDCPGTVSGRECTIDSSADESAEVEFTE